MLITFGTSRINRRQIKFLSAYYSLVNMTNLNSPLDRITQSPTKANSLLQ